ncbi:MAG: hypothetical protein ACRDY7_00250, partial [Acidimicrobiia bacterium]
NVAEGRLEALPAGVNELVSAGAKLPGSLFEAEGANGAGGNIGVRVGIYDTGGGDPISVIKEAVAQATPNAAVSPTNVCGREGVRTLLRWDDEPVEGGSVICDYWARTREGPASFILLRFWRTGPASPDEEELFDDVAGSVIYDDGGSFAGLARPITLRRYGPPDSEVVEPGRFRYAGCRLGTVFHTKMISAKEAELATEMAALRDTLLLVAVFLPWIVATLVLVGVGPILLLGGVTAAGTLPQLRSRGLKAVVMLAVVLAGLLAFGVATS